jgi:hypothetical protein
VLEELPHPGQFEEHVLAMDELESATTTNLPPNINRYILRSVDMDVVAGERTVIVYTKLPRLAIVGFVETPGPRNSWQGTRIAAGHGTIMPRGVTVPKPFGDYYDGKGAHICGCS